MAMVEFFNRVALLAASEILAQDTACGRARAISKVIQVCIYKFNSQAAYSIRAILRELSNGFLFFSSSKKILGISCVSILEKLKISQIYVLVSSNSVCYHTRDKTNRTPPYAVVLFC